MGAEPSVPQAGKRSARRARVLLAAKLRTGWGEIDAKLRDISQKGALIECNEPLATDSEVMFSRGRTVVPARIAWAAAGRAGLEFLRPIDESEVLVQLGRPPAGPAQPRCRRPRVLAEDMSAEERRLARVWGAQVGIPVTGK